MPQGNLPARVALLIPLGGRARVVEGAAPLHQPNGTTARGNHTIMLGDANLNLAHVGCKAFLLIPAPLLWPR